MADLESLQKIYDQYEVRLGKVIAKAGFGAGLFGMGDDPRKHGCNDMFYEELEQWAAEFAAGNPSEEEAAQAVRWILSYSAAHKGGPTYWYSFAAQKHAGGIISHLAVQDAARILEKFQADYPRDARMPVQEEILKLLRKQSGQKAVQAKPDWLQVWGVRVILLLVGLTIAHLGVTLFLLADLGSDPFNVMIQGLHRMVGIGSHGTVHMVICFVIILALLVIDRSYVRIGTFLCMLLGGPIIDVFTLMLQGMVNSGSHMVVRILAVVLGCGILAFGMTIVIKSEAGTGPNDLVAVVISDKLRWKFGAVRIAVDMAFALVGFVLGGTVGLGTIICLAVVGPVAQAFMPFSEKLCGRFLAK